MLVLFIHCCVLSSEAFLVRSASGSMILCRRLSLESGRVADNVLSLLAE